MPVRRRRFGRPVRDVADDEPGAGLKMTPSGSAAIEGEEATETFVADDFSFGRHGLSIDEPVVEPLVVSFCMIVRAEFTDGPIERPLPEEDHACETLFLDCGRVEDWRGGP